MLPKGPLMLSIDEGRFQELIESFALLLFHLSEGGEWVAAHHRAFQVITFLDELAHRHVVDHTSLYILVVQSLNAKYFGPLSPFYDFFRVVSWSNDGADSDSVVGARIQVSDDAFMSFSSIHLPELLHSAHFLTNPIFENVNQLGIAHRLVLQMLPLQLHTCRTALLSCEFSSFD